MIIVILACFSVYLFSKQSYYSSVEQALSFRIKSIENSLSENVTSKENYSELVSMVRDFQEKDKFEVIILDIYGNSLVTSSGFAFQEPDDMDDFQEAVNTEKNASYIGYLNDSEHIMSLTHVLDRYCGDAVAVRIMCSLTNVDQQISDFIGIIIAVGLAFIILISVTGLFFVRSMTRPIKDIGESARRIASGAFDTRIDNRYSGELGDLCDIVNDMASELENTDKLKNDFISSISHELRTPLTSIKGWGETLNQSDINDKELYHKGLEIITSESERLASLVEDLLDFSRLEASRSLKLNLEKIDLGAELYDFVLTFSQRSEKSGIHIKFSEPDNPVIVKCDRNRIRQVVNNILDNSLKYSSYGDSIRVTLFVEEEYGAVSIEDSGPGIPKEDLDRITERYFQASNAKYGTGIGLALVKEIISAHKGMLNIESELGKGTKVTFCVPLYKNSIEQED